MIYENQDRYDINIALCQNCGHAVNAANLILLQGPNGISYFNKLTILNNIVVCCKNPDYTLVKQE